MIFETDRLYVQQYLLDDFEDFCKLNSDEEVMLYIRPVKSREETFQFFQENIAFYKEVPEYGRWALYERENKEFIGSFMLRPSSIVKGEIELGYALYKRHWGNGYASEATRGGLEYAFGHLQLQKVVAVTQPKNISSQSVLLKCGFLQESNIEDNGRILNLFRIFNKTNG